MQKAILFFLVLFLSLSATTACRTASGNVSKSATALAATPCQLALAPSSGSTPLDQEITQLQIDARADRLATQRNALLEKLGWKFVEKARSNFDPGAYKLAEACALCLQAQLDQTQASNQAATGPETRPLQSNKSIQASALLLRGHALQNMHRFAEAEPLARQLVALRGGAYDLGLLGDVLLEQGKMDEATGVYRKMMELRPGPQAYSREAHLRWLRGDLDGARIVMKMAADASSQGDPEATAWAWSKQAVYELQAGQFKAAYNLCDGALRVQPNYAPALLARGRILLSEGRAAEAVVALSRAAQINPLPEYQWDLAEALRAAGREDEAQPIEAQIVTRGATADPRTLALFLATSAEAAQAMPANSANGAASAPGTATANKAEVALRLAQAELNTRRDVFTLDALAWAQAASGNATEAWQTMQAALAAGTQDGRLFFHAAVIASRAGDTKQAKIYAGRAAKYATTLLPSERTRLTALKVV